MFFFFNSHFRSNDTRGSPTIEKTLPIWHDSALLRSADQLDWPGRKLHGPVSVCWCGLYNWWSAAHLHGNVLLAARTQPRRCNRGKQNWWIILIRVHLFYKWQLFLLWSMVLARSSVPPWCVKINWFGMNWYEIGTNGAGSSASLWQLGPVLVYYYSFGWGFRLIFRCAVFRSQMWVRLD